MAVTTSPWSHRNLGAWQLACIHGGHSVLWSHDVRLGPSRPSSNKWSQWRSWKNVANGKHVTSCLTTRVRKDELTYARHGSHDVSCYASAPLLFFPWQYNCHNHEVSVIFKSYLGGSSQYLKHLLSHVVTCIAVRWVNSLPYLMLDIFLQMAENLQVPFGAAPCDLWKHFLCRTYNHPCFVVPW